MIPVPVWSVSVRTYGFSIMRGIPVGMPLLLDGCDIPGSLRQMEHPLVLETQASAQKGLQAVLYRPNCPLYPDAEHLSETKIIHKKGRRK